MDAREYLLRKQMIEGNYGYQQSPQYMKGMKENWADQLYDAPFDTLSPAQQSNVGAAIQNDIKHNDKDAKKFKGGK